MTIGKYCQSFKDLAQDTCGKERSLACSFAPPSSVGGWEGQQGKGANVTCPTCGCRTPAVYLPGEFSPLRGRHITNFDPLISCLQ